MSIVRQELPLTLGLAVLVLAGCSPGQSHLGLGAGEMPPANGEWAAASDDWPSVIPKALRSRIHRGSRPYLMRFIDRAVPGRAPRSYTYVASQHGRTINGFATDNHTNNPPVCQIPNNYDPEGIATDAAGTLYVTASFPGAKVGAATFSSACGPPGQRLYNSHGLPVDIAVDGTTVYIANLNDGLAVPATIEVHSFRSTYTTYQLSDKTAYAGLGIAVDKHHNVFWSNATQEFNSGQVIEFPAGRMPGIVLTATKIGSDWPGGVLIDNSGRLLQVDQTSKMLYVYDAIGSQPGTLTARRSIRLMGTSVFCAFWRGERRFSCLDYEHGSVDVYAYPSGTYAFSYTSDLSRRDDPIGIAIH